MLLHPAYRLTIGEKIVDTTDEPQASTVVSITVVLDMNTPADSFTLALGQVGGFQPQRDDDAKIELGFADGELVQVMVGKVVTADNSLTTRRVIGHSAARLLLATTAGETFESMTAGQIVANLADRAGLAVARAEPGIMLPAYVVDGRRSVYRHLRDLAELCGFDLYINSDGEVVFAPFRSGNAIHIFDYGKQIIELEIEQRPPLAGQVQVWGESAGGDQGDGSWAWLTKDFSGLKGTGGEAQPVLLVERAALRTGEIAQSAAEAAFATLERQRLRGTLLSTGQPQVKLGDAIEVRRLPDETFNGTYQVRSVRHHLDKRRGFTTRIGFRAI
jgi:phage protein D